METSSIGTCSITPAEFTCFRRFIYDHAGIALTPHKQQLVAGRLCRRLHHYGFGTYSEYLRLIAEPGQHQERQTLVDLLTTNETSFFREPAHFELLREQILPPFKGRELRVWSAACSSGEEVYSLAMVCAEVLGMGDWQVYGSDISTRMLEVAGTGLYPMGRAKGIPREYLPKYCLKGMRSQAGYLLVDPRLKQRVHLRWANLKAPLTDLTRFDLIFLRNVLIYFDVPTKQEIVRRICGALKPGGYLFVSHVESLHGVTDALRQVCPSVFRKPDGA